MDKKLIIGPLLTHQLEDISNIIVIDANVSNIKLNEFKDGILFNEIIINDSNYIYQIILNIQRLCHKNTNLIFNILSDNFITFYIIDILD